MNSIPGTSTPNSFTSIYDSYFVKDDNLSIRMASSMRKIAHNKEVLSKYLNMLSYMEFVGSRTLMNMMSPDEGCVKISHIIEELRHTRILRKAAESLTSKKLSYSNDVTFCKYSTHLYMVRLIAEMYHDFLADIEQSNDRSLAYKLLVAFVAGVLEKRTIWWYSFILPELNNNSIDPHGTISSSLNEILEDEESHVIFCDRAMAQDYNGGHTRLRKVLETEKSLFSRLMTAHEKHLSLSMT